MKFSEVNLPRNIMATLEKMGFDEMTPIQEATYPVIAAGRDVCALAETGSGKTAAGVIPLIQKVDTKQNMIQGLVIVPTRELCLQYVTDIENLAHRTDLVPFAVYGGFSRDIQIVKLKHCVHILVATPGRLIDLIYEGVVDLACVKFAILDEADELLQEGFLSDMEFVLSCLVQKHQTMLFSATMPDDIKKLARDYLDDPEYISLVQKRAAPASIEHHFYYVHPKNKHAELLRLIETGKIRQAIIFCNARHLVDKLFRTLRRSVKNVDYIHAGLPQEKRTSIIGKFRRRKIHFLIATDVAGRGLDFTHVSHVINWDFPGGGDLYTHRTGRAGRMGRKGTAASFVSRKDLPAFTKVVKNKRISPVWIGRNPLQNENSSPGASPPGPDGIGSRSSASTGAGSRDLLSRNQFGRGRKRKINRPKR